MLASVMDSATAIRVSVEVVRTFVRLRELAASHKDPTHRLGELERKYDATFKAVFDAIRQLMTPPEKSKDRIGFHP